LESCLIALLVQSEFGYADGMETCDANRQYPCVLPAGDSAALIQFGDALDFTVNAAVLEFDNHLTHAGLEGVTEVSPALVSILVRFDPLSASYNDLSLQLQQLLNSKNWLLKPEIKNPARWKIPVLYGAEAGSDLTEVAGMLGVSEAHAIEQHGASILRVLTLGFAPGCCYLGLLPENWNLPRLKVIKPQVPAGAILVAVRQTVMASAAMPTGWRCIGRTPLNNFNASKSPPVAIKHGDEVQYTPISESEFKQLQSQQADDKPVIEQVL